MPESGPVKIGTGAFQDCTALGECGGVRRFGKVRRFEKVRWEAMLALAPGV